MHSYVSCQAWHPPNPTKKREKKMESALLCWQPVRSQDLLSERGTGLVWDSSLKWIGYCSAAGILANMSRGSEDVLPASVLQVTIIWAVKNWRANTCQYHGLLLIRSLENEKKNLKGGTCTETHGSLCSKPMRWLPGRQPDIRHQDFWYACMLLRNCQWSTHIVTCL